jgi:branched-chain amino acid aminotransferase
MTKFIINDQIIDHDKAFVHVSDLAILRGYGVFDFFRTVGLLPVFLDDHIDRFFRSSNILRLKCPVKKETLKSLILELISKNKFENSGIRMVLTGGESSNGYAIGEPKLIVTNEPLNPIPKEHFSEGVKLISYEYLRDIPEVKTTNYLMGIYNMPEIIASGAVDQLYHWQGKISELTRSNFFIVDQNNKIITAADGVLKGVNRKYVLQIARQNFEVEERDVYIDELASAKEAFITGTTKLIMPVRQIDDIIIGDGKRGQVTIELQKMYEDFIAQHLQVHR